MKKIRNHKIEFRCTKEEKEKIEELAKYLEMPNSTMVRNLTMASYDDAIIFKKIGLLKGMKNYSKFKEKYKDIFKPSLPGFE